MRTKATAAKRITFIEPGASPVKLCMAVGEPGDYYVMLTSSCKWTGMHRVGGPGPTDPVQTASFNVSEALFSDHHGRRITHSVCSKVLVLCEHENEMFCAPLMMHCTCDFLLNISFICHYATVHVLGSSFCLNIKNRVLLSLSVFIAKV